MKIWEAVQMLEQMDQNKEVTVTFGTQAAKVTDLQSKYQYVIGKEDWVKQVEKDKYRWPYNGYDITCNANERWLH